MDSVFLRENRGHLSENLSTKNYSFGAKMRIIRRLPPNGSHPLRIPRKTRAQVKLAKSLAWPKEWGPCCVAFGRARRSHRRGRGFDPLTVHQNWKSLQFSLRRFSRLTTEIPQTDFCFDHLKGTPFRKECPSFVYCPAKSERVFSSFTSAVPGFHLL